MYTVDIMQHRTAFWLRSMFSCEAELVKCALFAMQQLSHGEVRDKMVKWLESDVMPSIFTALMAWLDGDFMPQVHAEAKKMKVAPKNSSTGACMPKKHPSPRTSQDHPSARRHHTSCSMPRQAAAACQAAACQAA